LGKAWRERDTHRGTAGDRHPVRYADEEAVMPRSSAVEALLQGIATDYPRLLQHGRRLSGAPKLHHLHA
jgi:hypothetical protein